MKLNGIAYYNESSIANDPFIILPRKPSPPTSKKGLWGWARAVDDDALTFAGISLTLRYFNFEAVLKGTKAY